MMVGLAMVALESAVASPVFWRVRESSRRERSLPSCHIEPHTFVPWQPTDTCNSNVSEPSRVGISCGVM